VPTLTSRYGKGANTSWLGRPSDDAMLIEDSHYTHTHTVSTLQGGGKRGYRIDAESAAGGHLIVSRGGGCVDR
jgi:hypothetical protein